MEKKKVFKIRYMFSTIDAGPVIHNCNLSLIWIILKYSNIIRHKSNL